MVFEPDTPNTPEHSPAPEVEVDSTGQEFSTKVRFTTITWGLMLLAVGVGVMVLASGYRFDAELALIGLLGVAGLTLVGGSIVRAIRK